MSFAVIIELAAWTAFAVILLGGVQQRNQGWKMVCGLLTTAAVVQAAGDEYCGRCTVPLRSEADSV